MAEMQIDLRELSADQQELRGSLIMNGYNFTERVRKVLAMAREEAARLNHEYVGTEHILLAVIREGEGVAATALQNLEADLDEISFKVEQVVKKGRSDSRPGPDLPYTSRAKKTLELAMSHAREVNHSYVGTEHLLLGLLEERKGIAAQVLIDFGVTLEKARHEIVRILGTDGETETAPPRFRAGGAVMQTAAWTNVAGLMVPERAERVRIVLNGAQDVAAESGSASLLPIHLAIALVQHGEGLANGVLDRIGCDRNALLHALEDIERSDAPPAEPEQVVSVGGEMLALQPAVEAECRRTHSLLNTLHILVALLETEPRITAAFETQGVTVDRVKAEGRRISG
jgi:ATP-dependent Clp protease ATP-binding subunit ClpA